MQDYTKTQKKYLWPEIAGTLTERIGAERTEQVLAEAAELSTSYAEHTRDLKGFEKTHADAAYNISAIYIPLRNALGAEEAIRMLDDTWRPAAMAKCARYDRLPPRLFLRLCRTIAANAFGSRAGFVREDISRDRNEVRFHVTSCPYVRIMQKLGCGEACPIVCRQDEYSYGGLHGVAFERTMTLGRGDEKCDFCYRLRMPGEMPDPDGDRADGAERS